MTGRYFLILCYGERDQVDRLLNNDEIKHYAFIDHNNDHWLSGDSLPDGVQVGDPKKRHWHIALYTSEEKSPKTISEWAKSISDTFALAILCKEPHSVKAYFLHKDSKSIAKGKYQYNDDEFLTDDSSIWDVSQPKPKKEKLEWYDEFVDRIIQDGYCKRGTLLEYSRKFGKDFGYNYNKALRLCADVLGCDYNDLFCTPTERAAHNAKISRLEYETDILTRYRDYAVKTITAQVESDVLDRFNEDFKKQFYSGQS